ncbi:MAG: cyclic nucleotide-binding domain-containing protein [Ignavibacteriaceae bacterium]|nr:cyclic nucleotide-binding domain-containing protein [Ignavibacteriaceae bacterium]
MKKFNAGDIILRQDSVGTEFFILIQGKVGIYKDGTKLAEYTEPGTVVGEISAILHTPRSATIIALTDSEFIEIEGSIEDEIKTHPDIILYVLSNLAERLRQTTGDLATVASKMNAKSLADLMK